MKRLHVISITAACLFLLCAVSRAEQGKAAPGKIVLEDEEVTLLDGNGKELEKLTTSRTGKNKAAINKQVREKVLKSLGIKSMDELKGNRQLAQRYYKESAKFIKVKKLNPTRLKFLDEYGKLLREVPIGYSTVVSTVGAETIVARKSLWGDKLKIGRKIEQRIMRNPMVASSQNAVVVSENVSNFAVAQSAMEEKLFDGTEAANLGVQGTLEYYNDKGNMVWKKNFDFNRAVSDGHFSEDGAEVAVIEGCEMNCSSFKEKGIPLKRLIVFDSSGKEMLGVSLTSGTCQSYGGDLWLSSDGNFALVSCRSEKGWPKSVLINITEKKYWRAPYLISIVLDEDGREIREGTLLRIGVTEENELGSRTKEIDLANLSWEKLP